MDIPSPTCSLALAKQPTLDIVELGPYIQEPFPISQDPVPDYILVLPEVQDHSLLTPVASMEKWDHSIPICSCSLDALLSLVFDMEPTILNPSCSLDIFHKMILTCYKIILTFYWRIVTAQWRNHVWMSKKGLRT